MAPAALTDWPALDNGSIPSRISYERGVWGKLPGSHSDFKWIAVTPAFANQSRALEKELLLGSEDTPRQATHWRSLGEVAFAMVCYPSGSKDTSGRSGFLEKQVLSWRRAAEVPAAVGALALLPEVARSDASVWQKRRTQNWTGEEDSTVVLKAEDQAPLQVSPERLAAAAAAGFDELGRTVREEALADFYAHLLAGHRAVPLAGLGAPLGPAALAVLLLPLPRTLADGLSLAGWLPSRRLNPAELRRCWNAALGGTAPPPPPAEKLSQEHRERGIALARALLARDPASIHPRPVRPPAVRGRRPIQLAMWGPSSAGKTALLAQLYLSEPEGDWEAVPADKSKKFFEDMRDRILLSRSFPPATSQSIEQIEYRFRHRQTRVEVLLRLEDRAGSDSEKLTDSIRQHLAEADGLLLLFDPQAQGSKLRNQVWKALEHLDGAGERIGKEARPIAVCLSKADLLIRTLDDLHSVRADPAGFVRRNDQMRLTELVDRFCDRYDLFPVSAAGLRIQHGSVESVVFYDESLNPRLAPGGSPLNVMAPFAWLLDQVTSRSHE